MKKYLLLLGLFSALACDRGREAKRDENLISQKVISSRLGSQEVYGVQLRSSGEQKGFASYAIQLSLDDKVWLDTQHLQIIAYDTLETEVIFSEAVVVEGKTPELKIERIEQ